MQSNTSGVPAHPDFRVPAPKKSDLLKAALTYARQGVRVIPLHDVAEGACSCEKPECDHPGKHPRITGWPDAGTTDPRKIHGWWSRWESANVGILTGDLVVLDADPSKGGMRSLERIKEERGLPDTRTARTGSGGVHLYMRVPEGTEIGNSASKLAPGIDIRGERGCVVAPPSRSAKGDYSWMDRRPAAEAPPWLVEALLPPPMPDEGPHGAAERRTRKARKKEGGARPATPVAEGEIIPEGSRNATLTSIAGKLRARGATDEDLDQELAQVNAESCSPPLSAEEVRKIAGSAARWPRGGARDASGTGEDGPGAEVLDALEQFEARLWGASSAGQLKGVGGRTARDVAVALVRHAREHGRMIPAGVRVSIGIRPLALASAASKKSTAGAVRRLRNAGLVRRDDLERSGTEAGALVLLVPEIPDGPDPAEGHEGGARKGSPLETSVAQPSPSGGSGLPLRGQDARGFSSPFSAPRLRWSAPRWDREGEGEMVRSTIHRMGKTAGAVLDYLEAAGGTAAAEEIGDALGLKRIRDLRRRAIARLEAARVVECSGAIVRLSSNWVGVLEEERGRACENEAMRRDARRYARETEVFRVSRLAVRGWNAERIAAEVGLTVARVRGILGLAESAPPKHEPEVGVARAAEARETRERGTAA